jgi:hypothetical protein
VAEFQTETSDAGVGAPRPRPPLDPAPTIFPTDAGALTAYVVYWDARIPLSTESRVRLERQIRRAVLAELAEIEMDSDISITSVSEPDTRGISIQRL